MRRREGIEPVRRKPALVAKAPALLAKTPALSKTPALLAMTLALLLAPTQAAGATAADVAATHAYIRANYALAQAAVAGLASAQANVESYSKKIAKQCRGAGAGALQDEASQRLTYEVAGALWSVTFGTAAGPIGAFAHTVSALRWSNGRLTRMARSYARTLSGLANLRRPNLCGDVQAWKASGFSAIPASTSSFDQHVEALEARTIPSRLLAPYEQAGDGALVRRTTHLESELEANQFEVGFDDWLELVETLGLHQ
jgi:hypothetical protein